MSKPGLALDDVVKLEKLHNNYRFEPNKERKEKERNRLVCGTKTLIRRTETTAGLESIQLLMHCFDPTHKQGECKIFPTGLWRHLDGKIANAIAIERKPLTATERRDRKLMRKAERTPQETTQQLTPAEA